MAEEAQAQRVQLICLAAAALLELFFFVMEDRGNGVAWFYLERYLTVPAMVFLGATLSRKLSRQAKQQLFFAGLVLAWFFVVQTTRRMQEMEKREIGTFFCVYTMCLPFAAATRDGERQRGLKIVAALFLAVGVLLVGYGALLYAGALPEYLKAYVHWDGTRFLALGHPNLCATLLMISIAFCLRCLLRAKKRWSKVALAVWSGVQFVVLSLTNGRTTVAFACLLVGGVVFCALRKQGWKRFALALLAAVVVMGALFVSSQKIVKVNKSYLNSAAQQAEEAGTPVASQKKNGQSSWDKDIRTLNGRTYIWSSAAKGLRDNPQIKYVGTDYVGLIVSQYNPFPVGHTHNSWIEALYELGIPGLVIALMLTVAAVWDAVVLLWRNADPQKSCVALLVLCLLGCALLEPYLFLANMEYQYFDFLFLLCLGYLHVWRTQAE